MSEMCGAVENLTVELLWRVTRVLCELDALNLRVDGAPRGEQEFLHASIAEAQKQLDGIVTLLRDAPIEEYRN